jgi:hypothetical protein
VFQVGVTNIREYEDRHLQAAERANQERAKLKMQVSNPAVGCRVVWSSSVSYFHFASQCGYNIRTSSCPCAGV